MAVTLKCADCGHTVQAPDDTPRTCPECDGTMKKPAYKAKSGPTSSDKPKPKARPEPEPLPLDDDEPQPKKAPAASTPAARPTPAKAAPPPSDNPFDFSGGGGDEEDEPRPKARKPAPAAASRKPAAKAEPEPLPLDDEDGDQDDGGDADVATSARAAKRIGIDPGFGNKKLMRQVAKELSRGEVLHWVARPSMEIAEKKAKWLRIGGGALGLIGIIVAVVLLAVATSVPWYVGVIIGVVFTLFGVLFAVLGPKSLIKQAESGWYAVTDRRAIVFSAPLWGSQGNVESYTPRELRKMWVRKSSWVKGGGDLIFKTDVHDNRTKWVDKRTGRTVKTTGSRTEHHYGFLGIEDVKDVETLIHDVLLHGGDEDTDEDDGEE